MALNSLGLGFVLTARDLASSKFMKANRSFRTLEGGVGRGSRGISANLATVKRGMVALTIATGALAAAGVLFANKAGKFEQGLAAVGAVTNATAKEMGLLQEAAFQAGIKTQFSPTEAVEGLTSLATAGQNAQAATETLIPVLDLAAGSLGQLGVGQAANAVVGTLNAYGMEANKAVDVTDRLLRITQLTNFQTRDFEVGLSKAAAAGALFDQDLNDVLLTMGLVRNMNVDASTASTAVRESLTRLGGDERVINEVRKKGIKVFDKSTGKMRAGIDIMQDFGKATKDLDVAERKILITRVFGKRGMIALAAVMNATKEVMVDGRRVTLRGADAIKFMREEMSKSSGTAVKFKDALLDTFEGQKTLLKGTIETFAIAIGLPIAKALKPTVKAITGFLNMLVQKFQALPDSTRKAIGKVVLALGALASALGALLAGGAGIGLLIAAVKTAVVTFSALGVVMLKVVLPAAAALAVVGRLLFEVWKRDLGGLRTFIVGVFNKIALAFKALKQLFTDGGFSGAVREEINKVENSGVKRFAIAIFRIAFRIQQFFVGVQDGIRRVMQILEPVFTRMREAFSALGNAVGDLFSIFSDGANSLPGDQVKSFGDQVGGILAQVIGWVARAITVVVRFATGWVKGIKAILSFSKPILAKIGQLFGQIIDSIAELLVSLGVMGDEVTEATGTWETLGKVFAIINHAILVPMFAAFAVGLQILKFFIDVVTVFTKALNGDFGPALEFIATAVLFLINPIAGVIKAIFFLWRVGKFVFNGIVNLATAMKDAFLAIPDAIKAAFDLILDTVRSALSAVPDFVFDTIPGGDALKKFANANNAGVADFTRAHLDRSAIRARGRERAGEARAIIAQGRGAIGTALPEAEQRRAGVGAEAVKEALSAAIAKENRDVITALKGVNKNLKVEMDGTVVGQIVAANNTEQAERGLAPTSVQTFF